MVDPVLPPLPDRGTEPADNPVAAEPAAPPAEATELVEETEVVASLIPCVLRHVFRLPCQRSHRLVALSSLFALVSFLCISLPGFG